MEPLSQKWSLISLLEPVKEGYEFFWKEYPLHITLAAVFAIDWQADDNIKKLETLLASLHSVATKVTAEGRWGSEGQYPVMLLEKSAELMHLHNVIHQSLLKSGAKFNQPEFEGGGYVPHVTIQKHAHIQPGDAPIIDSISILDMFPQNDGYQRKILKTIKLSNL